MRFLIIILLISGCAIPLYDEKPAPHLAYAYQYLGYTEQSHAVELKAFMGVNPRYTEWCAAFVNKVLEATGIESVDSLDYNYPLAARSYLNYGTALLEEEVRQGDILIFQRGNSNWKGHVGFYVGEEIINGRTYYRVLGGNQSNEVNISLYPKYKLLGIRRPYEAGVLNVLETH